MGCFQCGKRNKEEETAGNFVSDPPIAKTDDDASGNNTSSTSDEETPRKSSTKLSRWRLSQLWKGKQSSRRSTKPVDVDDEEEMMDTFDSVPPTKNKKGGPPPTRSSRAPASFRPSYLQSKITEASNETSTTTTLSPRGRQLYNQATAPPPARQAAFHGPVRFDWIDIEYAAATKIQSIHRRNMAMKNLEEQGLGTSAIRNRKRRRQAINQSYHSRIQQHAETPSLFNCCAVGLAFGDATADDEAAYREYQRQQYEQRIQQQQEHEDAIRSQYLKEHGMKEAGDILQVLETTK